MGQSGPRPRRVLVIEDDKDAADAFVSCLRAAGHTVEVAYDGVAGLEAARRFNPEVILCDIVLPGIDGYYVAGALKDDPQFAHCYFIAVSAHERQATRAHLFREYFRKPIDPMALVSAVERAQLGA